MKRRNVEERMKAIAEIKAEMEKTGDDLKTVLKRRKIAEGTWWTWHYRNKKNNAAKSANIVAKAKRSYTKSVIVPRMHEHETLLEQNRMLREAIGELVLQNMMLRARG